MLTKKTTDQEINSSFIRAFTMIQASSAAGVSFFQKKRLQNELKTYMDDLRLLDYASGTPNEQNLIIEDWRDFARSFISSCVGSKAYCSTLFGIVPIKDSAVAQKIAMQIDLVTRIYPAKFGMDADFIPLRNVLINTYCQMLENGETYWNTYIEQNVGAAK